MATTSRAVVWSCRCASCKAVSSSSSSARRLGNSVVLSRLARSCTTRSDSRRLVMSCRITRERNGVPSAAASTRPLCSTVRRVPSLRTMRCSNSNGSPGCMPSSIDCTNRRSLSGTRRCSHSRWTGSSDPGSPSSWYMPTDRLTSPVTRSTSLDPMWASASAWASNSARRSAERVAAFSSLMSCRLTRSAGWPWHSTRKPHTRASNVVPLLRTHTMS